MIRQAPFAQSELGDIVYIDIEGLDETLDQNEVFGSVEAVKTVSDLFMPISGEVTAINETLADQPERVNTDPYDGGWMIEIKAADPAELDNLKSKAEYLDMLKG